MLLVERRKPGGQAVNQERHWIQLYAVHHSALVNFRRSHEPSHLPRCASESADDCGALLSGSAWAHNGPECKVLYPVAEGVRPLVLWRPCRWKMGSAITSIAARCCHHVGKHPNHREEECQRREVDDGHWSSSLKVFCR